jgi:ribosome modulation factor
MTVGELTLEVPTELGGNASRGSGRFSAYVAGAYAALYGKSVEQCPYDPGRGSGSFRKAWLRGHEAWTTCKQARAGKVVA